MKKIFGVKTQFKFILYIDISLLENIRVLDAFYKTLFYDTFTTKI